jgi:hypothetical protein
MLHRILLPTAIISLSLMFVSCQKEVTTPSLTSPAVISRAAPNDAPTVTPFATGLTNPRGLKFGPDGNLYVAEAGVGGNAISTQFNCTPQLPSSQVPPPVGPYYGSPTGARVSKIDMSGHLTTITTDLPTSRESLGDAVGAADVAFVAGTLYVLETGGGCSHGVPTRNDGIYRVNTNGSTTLVADLSTWQAGHPVANPEPDDFEPDGSWYSMVEKGNQLYALEANHGELVKVDVNSGSISRVIDISASQGHIVPTSMDNQGQFYIGNLSPFPIMGDSKIMKINAGGHLETLTTGLFTVLGVVLDQHQNLYALEMTTGPTGPGPLFPTPGTGKILRISLKDPTQHTTIVSGLNFPTAMTMGPDGNLYVSTWGLGGAPGAGTIMKVALQ